MNVYVVNNETKKLDDLYQALQGHSISETTPTLISQETAEKSDFIILTGSHKLSLAGHDMFFKKEMDLVRETSRPVIGICLGFQIIAHAYGGFVDRLPVKHHGIKKVNVVGHDPMFENKESFNVYACHRWMVERIDFPLIGLARSEDGWEIVKHANKMIYGFQFHPEANEEGNKDGKWLLETVLNRIKY